MRRRLVSLLFLFVAFAFFSVPIAASQQKNFLWKVQSKTGTVYILGSIHFAKKEMYPLNRKIEEAFEHSRVLVVEADINDIGKIDLQKFAQSAVYPGEETIENHVSRETFETVRNELSGLGIPFELFLKQRPWFLALTLTSLELMKTGFDPSLGIDSHFLAKAAGKKKILELESIDYQMNLFSNMPDSEQETFLVYTLKDAQTFRAESDSLVNAWTSGDVKAMQTIVSRAAGGNGRMAPIYEKLLFERNRGMVRKIEGYLATGDTYFVVIGAGHLVGSRGILEILRGKGYRIEQL